MASEAGLGGFIRNEPLLGHGQWCVRVSPSRPVLEMLMAAEVNILGAPESHCLVLSYYLVVEQIT